MNSDNPYQSPTQYDNRDQQAKSRAPGLLGDLAIGFASYLILSTILGVLALLLAPEMSPLVGERAALLWSLPASIGLTLWLFVARRRKRRNHSISDRLR